ncbi:MAG: hypothetical protein E7527_04705 [Ruminococcaceae bacterium]|nr:hypothetical protein [Oscillospiraceae bacterium]
MTLEKEKRFLLLLSSYELGTNATKAAVLDNIVENGWVKLSDKDLETKHNRNELVWRNDFAFVRKHLTQENFFVNGIFNDWSITDAGKKELFSLCNDVACVNNFKYISSVAREKAEELTK